MSGRFLAEATPIAGLWVLERQPIIDDRGLFERLFCADELRAWGHPGTVAQANRSLTRRMGTVRGMHVQHPPAGEWKVIACLRGAVHDVVVDLRQGSPTFLRWHAVELAETSRRSLLVPPGCAHGFQVLRAEAEMHYFHSHPYAPGSDRGVRADDPRLAITWPLPIAERSPRDAGHPLLTADYRGISP
jgi:dTDP-4-dehydrorhamnose 3,5-epimerase